LSDFSEILRGEAVFSQNFSNGTDRPAAFHRTYFFCFANAFWALASGGFHIVTVVTILGEMTDAGKRMNQLRFRSYPADVLIRINPKIQIAGSVLLQILALVEVCAVLVQSSLGLLPRD